MKVYNNKKEKRKSWALTLKQYGEDIVLEAVDSNTGERVASLLSFTIDGGINRDINVKDAMKKDNYDPYEHGNSFDKDGAIVVN